VSISGAAGSGEAEDRQNAGFHASPPRRATPEIGLASGQKQVQIPAAWLAGFDRLYPTLSSAPDDSVEKYLAFGLVDEDWRKVRRLEGRFCPCPHGRRYRSVRA
jgi:hypothetical protein